MFTKEFDKVKVAFAEYESKAPTIMARVASRFGVDPSQKMPQMTSREHMRAKTIGLYKNRALSEIYQSIASNRHNFMNIASSSNDDLSPSRVEIRNLTSPSPDKKSPARLKPGSSVTIDSVIVE